MHWTISNILTLLRVALIPVIVALYLGGASGYLTAGVFLLAGLTDWADGFLARQRNEESPFGAFLDPVADKLMVSAVLVLMAADPQMREHVFSQACLRSSLLSSLDVKLQSRHCASGWPNWEGAAW